MPDSTPPNLIKCLQVRKTRHYATGQKFYRPELINSQTLILRTLHRRFRSRTKAENYGCAVAERLNRWLTSS